MLSRALKTAMLGVCTLLPIAASANNFNYNMFEVRMGSSPGTFGAEFNTYFTENTHIVARFDSEFSGDWDLAGGIGFNGPMGQFADIYGQMLLHNVKSDSSDTIGDEWKTEINIGSRIWLMENIEVHGRVGQLISNDDTASIIGIGARFHSTQQLSIGADIRNNGIYGHQILMSVRFHF
ncbi:hypothetical protein BOO91_16780 [Vibrio navarrensis]|uniref:Outer membrane protein beta-barrel domain-containing protein n=1 Tax=Vibrio navarrensis TaxID=29495 RepID=A0AAJ4LW94_9VIBR|nr:MULTISPECIES: hypothetical protein [Vibrio]KJR28944.1 hypothetical protein UF06_13460 [Vibrio sp. S234-5]MBE3651853.1 hypothetical protein [Vibrio navarrensis]MBE3658280.1 hypothetical protein [Vibrio navarrensis]MBE3662594.1 hypothetical protein [Vibrio navarrensis]MBE4602601.1 hypothetical protein [Vibrio navarrensis]